MLSTSLDRRRFLRMSGLALGGAAALAACGGAPAGSSSGGGASGAATPNGTVAVQLSWIKNVEFAGEYIADTKGYYAAAGFEKVDLLAGGSASTGVETNLVSGKASGPVSGPGHHRAAPSSRAPRSRSSGATYQKNPFCIVSLAEKPITDPAGMVGKKIGVQDANDRSGRRSSRPTTSTRRRSPSCRCSSTRTGHDRRGRRVLLHHQRAERCSRSRASRRPVHCSPTTATRWWPRRSPCCRRRSTTSATSSRRSCAPRSRAGGTRSRTPRRRPGSPSRCTARTSASTAPSRSLE